MAKQLIADLSNEASLAMEASQGDMRISRAVSPATPFALALLQGIY